MDAKEIKKWYLQLIKGSILNDLYFENGVRYLYLARMARSGASPDLEVLRAPGLHLKEMADHIKVFKDLGETWYVVDEPSDGDEYQTVDYRNYCDYAHSMIGSARVDNIELCLDVIRTEGIAGDLIETGVCRGGAVVFMRAYLAAHEMNDRTVWCADSFCGLPVPSLEQDAGYDLSAPVCPVLSVSVEQVQDVFRRYDLLDDQVKFLKGWFKDTLPTAPISSLSLLRLDGDLYESTMDSLEWLYPKLSVGGFVIVDDFYSFAPCRAAVADYLAKMGESASFQQIDRSSVFWRKA